MVVKNQYIYELSVCFITVVSLTLKIIIFRAIGDPCNGKYVVDGINSIY